MIIVNKKDLVGTLDSLNMVLKDLEEKVINTILIKGNGKVLHITGTDGLIYIDRKIAYEGDEIEINLPISNFYRIAKLCGEEITIEEISEGEYKVSSESAEWVIKSENTYMNIDFEDEGHDWEVLDKKIVEDVSKLHPLLDSRDREASIFFNGDSIFVENKDIVGTTLNETDNMYILDRTQSRVFISAFKDSDLIHAGYSTDDTMLIFKNSDCTVYFRLVGLTDIPVIDIPDNLNKLIILEDFNDIFKACDVTREDKIVFETSKDEKLLIVSAKNFKNEETVAITPATYKGLEKDIELVVDWETLQKAIRLINHKIKALLISEDGRHLVLADGTNKYRTHFTSLEYYEFEEETEEIEEETDEIEEETE